MYDAYILCWTTCPSNIYSSIYPASMSSWTTCPSIIYSSRDPSFMSPWTNFSSISYAASISTICGDHWQSKGSHESKRKGEEIQARTRKLKQIVEIHFEEIVHDIRASAENTSKCVGEATTSEE